MNKSAVLPTLDSPGDPAPHLEPLALSDIIISHKQVQPKSGQKQGAWSVFSSTFLTIFLAEMGDKTQITTLLMVAQSQSPWVVFAGAATALIATSILGVLLGRILATRLAPKTLESAAGATLLLISLTLLWDVIHF